MGPDVSDVFLNLTDVTLADQATNSIPTDKANKTIQVNVAMQVTQSGALEPMQVAPPDLWWSNLELVQVVSFGGQIYNKCKWCHQVVKFGTNASSAI
jgi:chitodextrinase